MFNSACPHTEEDGMLPIDFTSDLDFQSGVGFY